MEAEAEPIVDRGAVGDAAAELDLEADGAADRAHRRAVDRMPGEGAVEIDDMQPGKAELGEMPGLPRRVLAEHGRGRHVAADEADAGATLQIDGRIEDHGGAGSTRL